MKTSWTDIAATSLQAARTAWTRAMRRWPAMRGDVLTGLIRGTAMGAVIVLVAAPFVLQHRARPIAATAVTQPAPPAAAVEPPVARVATFDGVAASADARLVADWIARTRDNGGRPFAILDKRGARLYVFEPGARLVGTTLVLLGSAHGDDSTPGIGDKPLSLIEAHERTTPAGRFISEPGHDTTGENVVWVDYDGAVAMHRVRVVDPKERRFERIATDRIDDKRISNGCINVPVAFFDEVVAPWLLRSTAVVYILPEVKPLHQVFRLREPVTMPAVRTIPRTPSDIS